MLALRGLPALQFLTTTDPDERLMLIALARRAQQLHEVDQTNLAVLVVNTLAKAMKKR